MYLHLASQSGSPAPPDEGDLIEKDFESAFPEKALPARPVASIIGINSKRNAEEIDQTAHTALKSIGLDGFGYGRYSRLGDTIQIVDFFGHFVLPPWAKRYVEQRYYEVDPRVHFAFRHELPFVWDLSSLNNLGSVDRLAKRFRQFLAEAEHAGVRSGIAFGISNPNTVERAFVSFYSAKPTKEWIVDSVVGQTYAVGLKIHELLTHHVQQNLRTGLQIDLTEIQRQTLKLVINGVSRREIAHRLDTSPQNIDYHILQLRKKFGVRNHVQLAYVVGRLMLA
ncbi:regulatory LuxR family protein [Collimonas sp. PA-H2]|uniref:helix-turn-helix transcriptional regulator n=1 Tax=Collimonas sp. PA-H2 TaxID=1881062 RepID=UPI000BF9CD53|nr:LuxR family transcriptional regulator [Collimonas sp. PA-H2]PFH08659.1 regulatory LuxR family protein [Collimonas sp. PA-H2]